MSAAAAQAWFWQRERFFRCVIALLTDAARFLTLR
jgi:hypothetical protein